MSEICCVSVAHAYWRNVLCTNRLSNLPGSTLTFACVATEEGSTAVISDQLRLLLRPLPERESNIIMLVMVFICFVVYATRLAATKISYVKMSCYCQGKSDF